MGTTKERQSPDQGQKYKIWEEGSSDPASPTPTPPSHKNDDNLKKQFTEQINNLLLTCYCCHTEVPGKASAKFALCGKPVMKQDIQIELHACRLLITQFQKAFCGKGYGHFLKKKKKIRGSSES